MRTHAMPRDSYEWNRKGVYGQLHAGILGKMLEMEERLSGVMPTEQGKFILIHAMAAGQCNA